MADLVITDVRIVEWLDKFDAPAAEVFAVGEAVRFHTDGAVTPANGTSAGEAAFQGIATLAADRVGQAVTVVRDGLLDVGEALAALAYGAPVYLSDTDGVLEGTDAATVDVIIGRVEPGWGGLTSDKLLRVRKES
jgi:hypothetical protein